VRKIRAGIMENRRQIMKKECFELIFIFAVSA
jgi:hypothetical protein